jgi:mono/diheme cytochrome c family protein
VKGLATVLAVALVGPALTTACSDHEFHPPSEEERQALADSVYSPTLFDSLAWSGDSTRIAAGNLVYADECRRCHGVLGQGETEYAATHELDVPSLVAPEWDYDDDLEAVRRRIFIGHASGMPNWGVGHLSPRQIDAAAFYILEQLRPEVLQGAAPTDSPPVD